MKIAIAIPAHNEAAVVEETVRWTIRVVQPSASPVFVIADRCTDDTGKRARAAGASVYVRLQGRPSKGAALAWFLDAASKDLMGVEALLVLDADSRLQPGAIEVLAQALAPGIAAAQAFVQALLPEVVSPTSLLAAYSEWLSQAVRDRLRRCLRASVPLRGTGMALRMSTLQEIAPLLRTRVEDVELTILLLLRKQKIAFAPEAIVKDPKALEPHLLSRQRARWLQGQWEIWRLYGKSIVGLLLTCGPGTWSLLGTLLLKPRTFILLIKIILILMLGPFSALPIIGCAVALLSVSLCLEGLCYGCGLFFAPRAWRRPLVWALLKSPLYLLIWIRALAWSLVRREAWLRARD